MKDALIVEFQEVFDTTLVMRVVHQDDSKIKRGEFRFEHDGLSVESADYPAIRPSILYLRGTDTPYNFKECAVAFASTEIRTAYLAKAKAAIAALNESLADKPLTFERIRKECVSGESVLISPKVGYERVFVGFLNGQLFTSKDIEKPIEINQYGWWESEVATWKIKGAK